MGDQSLDVPVIGIFGDGGWAVYGRDEHAFRDVVRSPNGLDGRVFGDGSLALDIPDNGAFGECGWSLKGPVERNADAVHLKRTLVCSKC